MLQLFVTETNKLFLSLLKSRPDFVTHSLGHVGFLVDKYEKKKKIYLHLILFRTNIKLYGIILLHTYINTWLHVLIIITRVWSKNRYKFSFVVDTLFFFLLIHIYELMLIRGVVFFIYFDVKFKQGHNFYTYFYLCVTFH